MVIDTSDAPADDLLTARHPVRRWNDRAYKKFVTSCAQELDISIQMLYKRAGVDPSCHSKNAGRYGRSIEQILAIADASGKDPALFIAAGILGQKDVSSDLELAKLAVISTLASHLYVALSPARPSPQDIPKLLRAVLAAMKAKDI